MKAIITGGTSGIGKAIVDALDDSKFQIIATSSKELDTSNINQIKKFVQKEKSTDVLVLNTGGPPAKEFFEINEEEWLHYFYQLFYGFVYLLQNLHIIKFLYQSFTVIKYLVCKRHQ